MPPPHWPGLDRCQAGETMDTLEAVTDTESSKVHKSDDDWVMVSAILITNVAVTVWVTWVSLLTPG